MSLLSFFKKLIGKSESRPEAKTGGRNVDSGKKRGEEESRRNRDARTANRSHNRRSEVRGGASGEKGFSGVRESRDLNTGGGRFAGGERGRSGNRDRGERRSSRDKSGAIRPASAPKTFPAPEIPSSDWDPASYSVAPKDGAKRFTDFQLPVPLLHGIADLGFEYCTPIQAASLERTMAGDNVAGRAQTGTGKTAAFLIAIMKRMLENPQTRPTVTGRPAALVLAPTRELVIQIVEDAKKLGKHCAFRTLAVYGGCDHEKQQAAIESAPLDLIAATPGRLLDFRRAGVLDLSGVHTLVIDEADRMLDMGFIPDVRNIVRSVSPERQTLLFSATLNDEVMRLAAQWMPNPVQIAVDDEFHPADTILQVAYPISTQQKFTVLYHILKKREGERVLVFRNRKSGCEDLVRELQSHDIPALELSGDVDQRKRIKILDDFRNGNAKVVVATDVAARGLQVDGITLVVNYDFPYEPDDYIHRIGRTGRAGEAGTAISFACEDESFIIPDIEKLTGHALPCEMPDEECFAPPPEPTHKVPRREHHAPSGARFGGSRGHGRGGPPSHRGPRRR